MLEAVFSRKPEVVDEIVEVARDLGVVRDGQARSSGIG